LPANFTFESAALLWTEHDKSCPQLTVDTNGGFTIRSTVAVALLPTASVTVTVTVKVPVAVGVHVSEETFADEHPEDRPA